MLVFDQRGRIGRPIGGAFCTGKTSAVFACPIKKQYALTPGFCEA